MTARHARGGLPLFCTILILLVAAGASATDLPELPGKDPSLHQQLHCGHRMGHLHRSGEGQPGQTEWSARYYEIEGSLDFAAERFHGTVRAYLTPIAGVDHLVLDAFDTLSDIEIRVDGVPTTDWSRLDGRTIDIPMPTAALGVENVVEVSYEAAPNYIDFGAFWFPVYQDTTGYEYKMCQTMTETQNAGTWWPCIDRLTHKPDSLALAITVPDTMLVASNGILEALDEPGDGGAGTRTYRWRERYPIATYLVSITVAPYYSPAEDGLPWIEEYDLDGIEGGETLPLHYFIRPHHLEAAQRNLPWIEDMLDAFRERFGEYPYIDEKYGIAEFSFLGGMEHQTISSVGPLVVAGSDSLSYVQSHELAHQWFGDAVSPATWEDIWLNEGFATYGEAIYYEHFGRYTAGEYMKLRRRLPGDALFEGSVYAPTQTFGTTSYWKGGWVLHMLRELVGDDAFFTLMRSWVHETPHPGGVATTAEFQTAAETVTGHDLDAFFDRWVYGTGRPVYSVEWSSSGGDGDWDLAVLLEQAQAGPLFPDSLDIQVEFADGARADTVIRVQPAADLNSYHWSFDDVPVALNLDPGHRLLFNEIPSQTTGAVTLYAPFPNPMIGSATATISLAVREPGSLLVEIYDVLGRRVTTLAKGVQSDVTALELEWSGKDDAGERQGNGVYLVRARLGNYQETRKLIYMPTD